MVSTMGLEWPFYHSRFLHHAHDSQQSQTKLSQSKASVSRRGSSQIPIGTVPSMLLELKFQACKFDKLESAGEIVPLNLLWSILKIARASMFSISVGSVPINSLCSKPRVSIYHKEGYRVRVNVSCSKSSTSTIATFGTYLAKRENRFRWECYHPAGFAQCLKPEDSLISRFQLGSCLRGDWMSFGIELLISVSGKGNKERVRDAFRVS